MNTNFYGISYGNNKKNVDFFSTFKKLLLVAFRPKIPFKEKSTS